MRAYVRAAGREAMAGKLEAFLNQGLDVLAPHASVVFEEHALNHLLFGYPMPSARAMADQALARARLTGDWPKEPA